MLKTRVQINSVVENQVPGFIRDDFPLVTEFLKEYYRSQEISGAAYDILQNIDQYVKIDELADLIDSTTVLKSDDSSYSVGVFDDVIYVESTQGFPDKYGLIKIDNEIITYKSKTDTYFSECIRGFSGVENLKSPNNPEKLVFSSTEAAEHKANSKVTNLSILFLKEFFQKVKSQISPGFEGRELNSSVNERLFFSHAKDFYTSKGTDESFKILFKSLYGTDVKVIKPRDFLIEPSNAGYRVTKDIVVEAIKGNPKDLVNRTLFQDPTGSIVRSYGSVTSVEKITRAGKEYYILSLDYDFDKDISVSGSIFGEFSIHPKTKLINSVSTNTTTLDVDSTVGFPLSGTLIARLDNGNTLTIKYTSKTLNQFFGCTGITETIPSGEEIFLSANAYAFLDRNTNSKIEVRIGGVLSEFDIPENTYQYEKGDTAKIISLGTINNNNIALNNWLFNVPVKYNVESSTWLNPITIGQPAPTFYRHEVFTYDDNVIYPGDSVEIDIVVRDRNNDIEPIYRVNKVFVVESGSVPNKSFIVSNDNEILKVYSAKKILTKVVGYDYTANVQNTYEGSDGSVYVASPSLPNYSNDSIDIRDRSIEFSGTIGNPTTGITTDTITFRGSGGSLRSHGFLTGDAVVYFPTTAENSLNLPKGVYFAKKVNINSIKLASSRENISNNVFLSFYGNVVNNKIVPFEFVDDDLNQKTIDSQRLLRKLNSPENDGTIYPTTPGFIGILANGVEVINYKSSDTIYYGGIEQISVSSKGDGYDVINPPVLELTDSTGSGASGICAVNGSLKRIDIVDPGFDYIETPVISISGGGGSGAKAKANLISIDHSVSFNSEQGSALVNLSDNTITLQTEHKFRENERVFYITNGQPAIGGLVENSSYYVSVESSRKIKIYNTISDSISRINPISLTSYGSGIHAFKSYDKKKVIGSISVIDPGSNYRNKKIVATTSNINLANSSINIPGHGFINGDTVKYTPSSTPIGGLTSGEYIATKIDDNSFKLSLIDTNDREFYYRTNQYVKFTSKGSGTHNFNYPDVTVKITGNIGISTVTGQDYFAKVQPIFRGSIESIFVTNSGTGYGSQEVLNLHRKPQYKLNSGKDAKLQPVISNGRISQILILNPGSQYNSPPDIIVKGAGFGAVLTPIIQNGRIKEIKILNGGFNYTENTTSIIVDAAGQNCKLDFKLKSWNINQVERLRTTNQISANGGIISNGIAEQYGLEYSHAYAPKKLRDILFTKNEEEGEITYRSDLQNDFSTQKYHSPIIGWAYDGNPIYGPYGFSNPEGGVVKQLMSGYSDPTQKPGRPSISLYPLGFFVEDYDFLGNGDLDYYNGRFCKTPEFPNGTYAYFASLQSLVTGGEKIPKFPYLIGNSFKSKPILFNYDKQSNQDSINVQDTGWLRNTKPYNLNSDNSSYDYIINPNKIKQHLTDVVYSSKGGVDKIFITNGGSDYKVGDIVVFNNEGTEGYNAYASVSVIDGKVVEKIESDTIQVKNVEILPYSGPREYIAYSNDPHGIKNTEIISISGLGTYFSSLEKSYKATVSASSLILSTGIGDTTTTGIVTYFNVYGNLNYPNVRENDIYIIGTETVRILNIDKESSRVKVLRQSGVSSHISGEEMTEVTRKFRFTVSEDFNYNFQYNQELYFNPADSVGVGLVGSGSTITISNPGIGVTQVFIPIQSIYIPNHNLNTGDKVEYLRNENTPIPVSNGYQSFVLDQNIDLYVAKFSNDFIGLSTNMIGVGTTGSFVGVGTTTSILYFTGLGSGLNHSIKTLKNNVVSANVDKRTITVTTEEPHGIGLEDSVTVECKPIDDRLIKIAYNLENRRIVVDPIDFESDDVNIQNSTITIQGHNYKTGEKVIYSSDSPSSGLTNNKIYYIVVVDINTVKLSETYYNSKLNSPITVKILSQSSGTLSKVNPEILLFKNNNIIFDVSDASLSVVNGATRIPAFEFKIFQDPNFTNPFIASKKSDEFELKTYGVVGTTNARVELSLSDNIPNNLYYTLVPTKNTGNLPENTEIINDSEYIINANKIKIVDSFYNGTNIVTDVTDKTFSYTVSINLEVPEYTNNVKYSTTSKTAKGSIKDFSIKSNGGGYKKLPYISSVISEDGSGAILIPQSKTIGNVKTVKILDIGFDYSSDYSIRPKAKFPDILKIEPLSTFERIDIIYRGKGYDVSPQLIVLDGVTGKVVNDVALKYETDKNEVTIIKNSTGFYNAKPSIIPVNNPNGVGISTVSFNDLTKEVEVTLSKEFSDEEDFPFAIGEKVFVENVGILDGTGTGYNSEDYNYAYFTVTDVDNALGGAGSIVRYSLAGFILDSSQPGTFDFSESYGKIIPVKDFPIFNPILKKNQFLNREHVFTETANGFAEVWDSQNEYLKVETTDLFEINTIIKGKTSGSQGIISSVNEFVSTYKVAPNSIVQKGWTKETGTLNNSTQRIHNNDYYQYFSYSVKSPISYETWNEVVSTLDHTAGFKKFSDLYVESFDTDYSGISTQQNQGDFTGLADLSSVIDLDCYHDFDMVSENNLTIGNNTISNEIIFNSREIQDYSESIGNRVLKLDDISRQFNHLPRLTPYSIIDVFKLDTGHTRKYITYIKDKRYTDERQLLILTMLHDNNYTFLNQYARLESYTDLGSFDVLINGDEASVVFYPTKFEYNNYDVSFVNYTINQINAGIGSTSFGNIVSIFSDKYEIPENTSQTILTLPTTNKCSKVLIEIIGDNGKFEFDELTLLQNGSDVDLLEYGQLTNTLNEYSSSGLGTYYPRISGSEILVDYIPSVTGVAMTVTTLVTAINSTGTTPGSEEIENSSLNSNYISISSFASPIPNTIATYNDSIYDCAYYIVLVEDVTNNEYQVEEIVVVNDSTNTYISEYGILQTNNSLGSFSVNNTVPDLTQLQFTPNPNIETKVRVFQNNLRLISSGTETTIEI